MPPRRMGRLRKSTGKTDSGKEGEFNDVTPNDLSSPGLSKRIGRGKAIAVSGETRRTTRNKSTTTSNSASAVPDVFQDMLTEALSSSNVKPEDRPRKRRRVKQADDEPLNSSTISDAIQNEINDDDDTSMVFEDVISSKPEQTAYNDSTDGSSEDDLAWEEVENANLLLGSRDEEGSDGDLDLTLVAEKSREKILPAARRKALSKADRALRLNVHKMHLLCLLTHVDQRNNWCNDNETQKNLQSLLTKQMTDCLKPKESYTQFGKTESVKKGLSLILKMWESTYRITAKGMSRPFWAENEQSIKHFKLSHESDPVHEKSEFRLAAKELQGSRDVGAQLFCALLRSTGLEARLVCSLQVLPFSAATKTPHSGGHKSSPIVANSPTPEASGSEPQVDIHSNDSAFNNDLRGVSGMPLTARRRFGHPNAADYFMPSVSSTTAAFPKPKPKQKRISESAYPVFWVEVLDEAHQKWMSVNSMDPMSISKPRDFEPPISDPQNNMSYVVAFEDDGAGRDVTRRYTKAFNAKTLRNRVESTVGGERWWRRSIRFYSRGWKSDLDQIEDTELAAAEAREPMPKSVADFKDHPVYALERHLRRNEVLVNPKEVGKVAAGRDANAGKRLESVYRRRDVSIVKSADAWFRIGREVKVGEQPIKIVAPRKQSDDMEEAEESSGTALYAASQTELYEAPQVVNCRVPKNSYGNLDIYVPSMIPKGAVHVSDPEASRAARILAVDYADAVTGFEFRGRHGTAIIRGVVIATEYEEAVNAVIDGFRDEQAQAAEEMKSLAALRTWKRFMVGLRIKERVDGYEIEGEEAELNPVEENSGMDSEEYMDDGGGGFFPE